MAEINGVVKYGEISKGQRRIYIVGDDGQEREYSLPRGVHINVQEGESVMAGDPLMDGPRNPHDILDVRGEKEPQKYLVNETQEVYRLPGTTLPAFQSQASANRRWTGLATSVNIARTVVLAPTRGSTGWTMNQINALISLLGPDVAIREVTRQISGTVSVRDRP